jgi:hypothetical protein
MDLEQYKQAIQIGNAPYFAPKEGYPFFKKFILPD